MMGMEGAKDLDLNSGQTPFEAHDSELGSSDAINPNPVLGINLNEDVSSKHSLPMSEIEGKSKQEENKSSDSYNPLMGVEKVEGPMVKRTNGRGLCTDLNGHPEDHSELEAGRATNAGIGVSVEDSAGIGEFVKNAKKAKKAATVKETITVPVKDDDDQDLGLESRDIALQSHGDVENQEGLSVEVSTKENLKVNPIEEPLDEHSVKVSSTLQETLGTVDNQETGNSKEIPSSQMERQDEDSASARDITNAACGKLFSEEAEVGSPNCMSKEHDFSVGDLVWGKVKYHPWWPGQVFDPSDASELARQRQKKDRLLVAYFGDQTFAWIERYQLKPFEENFVELAKQTTAKAFCNAVDKALNELSRRVEFGLTCSCLSAETHDTLRNKSISNAGLREGAVVNNHRDTSLAATAYDSQKLLAYVRQMAEFPFTDNALEVNISRAQVFAFYEAQRYAVFGNASSDVLLKQASAFKSVRSSRSPSLTPKPLKSNEDSPAKHKQTISKKKSLKKRKRLSEDSEGYDVFDDEDVPLNKFETPQRVSKVKDDGSTARKLSLSTSRKSGRSEYIFYSGGKRKSSKGQQVKKGGNVVSPMRGDADGDRKNSPKSFKIGECIRKIASQLTGSPPIIKSMDQIVEKTSNKGAKKAKKINMENHVLGPHLSVSESPLNVKEDCSLKELLLELFLVAQNPMYCLEEDNIVSRVTSVFLKFRGEVFEKDSVYPSYRRSLKSSSKTPVSSCIEYDSDDLKNTDKRVASKQKGHSLRKTLKRKAELQVDESEQKPQNSPPSKKAKKLKDHIGSPDSTVSKEAPHSIANNMVDLSQESRTALFMKFPTGFALPSEAELIKMFDNYGQIIETEFFSDSGCAQVIFRRCSDAEAAFHGAAANKIFGAATVSFRLRYLSSRTNVDMTQVDEPREDEMTIPT